MDKLDADSQYVRQLRSYYGCINLGVAQFILVLEMFYACSRGVLEDGIEKRNRRWNTRLEDAVSLEQVVQGQGQGTRTKDTYSVRLGSIQLIITVF